MHPVPPNEAIVLPIYCKLENTWLDDLADDLGKMTGVPIPVQHSTLILPAVIGTGSIRHFNLEDGITAIYLDFTAKMPVVLKRGSTETVEYYAIGYDTSPDGNQYTMDNKISRLDYLRKYSAYFRTSDTPIELSIQANHYTRVLTLLISMKRIATLFPQQMRYVLKPKLRTAHGYFQINEELHENIVQIGQNLHNDSADYFFVKGVVNKLLAMSLPIIAGQQQNRRKPEVDKMVALMERLTSDFSVTPPLLRDASRMVGVSPSKFKAIFRKIYRSSYYQYLLQQKMEKAKELLKEEGQTITSVAYSLGYSSCSHFTRLFRKNFNLSPQEFKIQFRNAI